VAELRTARLLLREWRDADLDPFAALNADPEVMGCFPSLLTREVSDAVAVRAQAGLAERGFGLWAVEVERSGSFAGFVGLAEARFVARFTPATEIGWRLGRPFWGHGYATEAPAAVVAFGFAELGIAEIVAFTAVANLGSHRVIERLGMTPDPAGDFDHPLVADPSLRRHVLYRLRRPPPRGAA
jgi:ribosomal-protein-alanine N-acetyltransferase